jgi:hypothetical protein
LKILFAVGLIVLVLGVLSFFIPIPHTEHHGLDAGDVHVGVDTKHSDLLPPAASVALVVVGAGLMIAAAGGKLRSRRMNNADE